MSEVKTFRAATMQEALDLIRQDFGGEAIILHTRHISRRRFLPWKKRADEVEVTAGLGINIRSQVPRRRPKKSTATPKYTPATKKSSTRSDAVIAGPSPRVSAKPSSSAECIEQMSSDGDTLSLSSRPQKINTSFQAVSKSSASPQKDRFGSPKQFSPGEFSSKLDSIQSMLENLGRIGHRSNGEEIPSELFYLYTELIDAEVEDDLARELIFRLKQNVTPDQLNDHDAVKSLLAGMVQSEIRCSPPISPVEGKRKVVALVGATGVGKTTTIAKLAANFRLRDGIKMGLVTVDTYRIAAVEQLRTYAEIIDLPMKVVTNPLEMRRALDELVGLDLVLIDTAGRSPRDDLQIQELKRLLVEANVDEVHLVMSMTSSMRTLEATAEKFSAANTTSIIATKLDEAASMGTLLSLARKIPLPISYLTTGQDVPDDIESARPERIARLVLGEDTLFE
ncbi:MAG: flagellar biosynthesis protein FlhF [Planctomycetes bacterium]|nr:flagellar biosynthesis protein FlhF [Planctomycetota bacterium]